jgi:hypothetical protein
MNKYQSAVIWLGLALIFLRFLTTGQRSLFGNLFTSGGNGTTTPITPAQEAAANAAAAAVTAPGAVTNTGTNVPPVAAGAQPNPNQATKPKTGGITLVLWLLLPHQNRPRRAREF